MTQPHRIDRVPDWFACLLFLAGFWLGLWASYQGCEHVIETPNAPQSVSMPPTIDEDALDVYWTLRGGRWACKGPSCLSEGDLWSFSQAVVADAGKYGLDTRLVSGLLLVENPWLDPGAVSHAGAVGLFQVMPTVWDGVYPDCGDLSTVAGNMCYGLRILRHYLDRHDNDFDRALLAYNGCRPHWTSCNWYPSRVQAKGGLAR
jgi:hypothetical protein